jgi:hypothetical protein
MMKKIVSLLVALILVTTFTSCKKTDPVVTTPDGGSHDRDIIGTSASIIADGKTDYVVVLPADASWTIKQAAEEMVRFFGEASGIELNVLTDDSATGAKILSIGKTAQLSAAKLTPDYEVLGSDGYHIKTAGEAVYLYGYGDYGSLYAVYDLLGIYFGFEFFGTETYALDKNVRDLSFYEINITEVPDIAARAANYGVITADNYNLMRFRVRPYQEFFIPIKGEIFHNSFKYIEDYSSGHDAWYSSGGDQLCYTAHGDEEEYELMVEAAFQTLTKALIEYPDRDIATLTIEDNQNFCACDSCRGVVAEYGANSAAVILFVNDVREKVGAWFLTDAGKSYVRDFKLIFFAYLKTLESPTAYNAGTGRYEGKNGIKLGEGVAVFYAPISADYLRSLTAEENKNIYSITRSWADISDSIFLWLYSTNFTQYLAPYDTFNGMQQNYRFSVENKAIWLFDQAQWTETGYSTAWSALKAYLNAKLAWNVNCDYTKLIDDFFTCYFGQAAAEMRGVFDEMRFRSEYNRTVNGLGGPRSVYIDLMREEYWPKPLLTGWLDAYERAERAVSELALTDPRLKALYTDHIAGERLSTLYLLVELYAYNTDGETMDRYKAMFRRDADRLGMTRITEGGTMMNLYKKWGL